MKFSICINLGCQLMKYLACKGQHAHGISQIDGQCFIGHVSLHLLSSRDPLHFKFQKVNKCNGDVNVTKLNSKTKFPVTFTSFFYYLVKAGDSSCPFTPACPGARLFVLGATFRNKLERDLEASRFFPHSFGSFSQIAVNFG